MKIINLYFILCSLIPVIISQGQDFDFCDINKIEADPANLTIPNFPFNAQYQALIERNSNGLTEEIQEFFDAKNNVGIAITVAGNIRSYAYAYYPTNELLLVSGDSCKVLKLNESYAFTPFFLVTDQQGVEHIVSPLTIALRNLTFIYIGSSSTVRGIPVNEWQTCVYSKTEKRTYRITVSYSNPNKWTPAAPTDSFPSIPIQTFVESKNSSDEDYRTDFTSIFSFKPFLLLNVEDYFLPSGVFCPGRISLKPIPQVPKSFSFSVQFSQSIPDSNDRLGLISYYREEYDYNYKLFRFDYIKSNLRFTEIHDFVTGLNYVVNRIDGSCQIEKLKPGQVDTTTEGDYIQMRDPISFFDFDGVEYQYVGLKREDGINTDVWIGQKKLNGIDSILEWYFMSDTWNRSDSNLEEFKIPIKLVVTSRTVDPNNPTNIQTNKNINNFFNFRKIDLNLIDFDITSCINELEKQTLVFNVAASNKNLIKSNLEKFKQATVIAIQKIARVVLLRISLPNVIFYDDYIFVIFSIYQRSKFYGDVLVPKDDLLLKDAVENIKVFFSNNNLEIKFDDEFRKEVLIQGISKSLDDHFDNEGYVYFNVENIDQGFSSSSILIVTLIVSLFGIFIGLFLVLLHKHKKINLPLIS